MGKSVWIHQQEYTKAALGKIRERSKDGRRHKVNRMVASRKPRAKANSLGPNLKRSP